VKWEGTDRNRKENESKKKAGVPNVRNLPEGLARKKGIKVTNTRNKKKREGRRRACIRPPRRCQGDYERFEIKG